MICKAFGFGALERYRYVVILSSWQGRILLSRHRARTTWETQGGHIEPGETPEEAARRELFEESGALDYALRPLCDYWAGDERTGEGANGQVFAAEIFALGPMPESEMAETRTFDALPDNLTYPAITPVLFARLEKERRPVSVLLGTTNPSKAAYFERLLAGLNVRLMTLSEVGVTQEPTETGATPEENARIKAAFYARYAEYVVCADSGLYVDALALEDPRQPGLHVRTPGGCPRLDDEAMIAYYARLAHALGGRVMAYYVNGLAVYSRGRLQSMQATREEARRGAFYLTDTPSPWRKAGWPLDSLSQTVDGVWFLDPARRALPQEQADRGEARMRAFLRKALGCDPQSMNLRMNQYWI